MGLAEHRQRAATAVRCAVITVSDTRTEATDSSGAAMARCLEGGGHSVVRRAIVPDEPARIALELRHCLGDAQVEAVLLNGGTGIAKRDGTPEVVRGFLDLEIPGFGELFRHLSWAQIRSAAMLSRAVGGVANGKPVFSVPGSSAAVALAMEQLIVPELGHLLHELRK